VSSIRTLARSFAAGEITPELYGRIDLSSFQTGLATCRNFITLPHGPATNRPGTEFVREVKDSSRRTRLIPFTFSTTQTMVLELGHQYIRFHTDGGTLLSGGVPYEVATPYAEADLFDIHFVQSADVLTLVHPSYAPRELRRLAATNWTLTTISFATSQPGFGAGVSATGVDPNFPDRLPAPTYVTITASSPGADSVGYRVTAIGDDPRSESASTLATIAAVDATADIGLEWAIVGDAIGYRIYLDNGGLFQLVAETSALTITLKNPTPNPFVNPGGPASPTENTTTHYYVLTAVGANGEESLISSECSALNDLTLPGAYNSIAPTAVITYSFFNVYKKQNGRYGYIGTSPIGAAFGDNNIEPDMTRQPPIAANPFASASNYPQAVSYFEQRRLFAGTVNLPQTLWATRTGTENNLSTNVVVRDDDAISFRIAAREANTIRHIVPLGEVILLTSSAEWRVTSSDGGAITPATVSVRPQSYIGASTVQPVVTNSSMLYAQARGGHIREILYSMADNGAVGYNNSDMSILAPHLFNFKTIVDLAFAKAPDPILWAVSSDGKLLGMTYVPEQKVAGWHRHDTDGAFESCAVVTEGDEDRLYVVVRRTINGSSKRYVERLHSRQFAALEDAFYVDCGDTYSGGAATTISGLGHLEGKTVSVLGNGAVFPQKVVSGGQITLEEAVTKAQIGLPITADMQTLPLFTEQISAFGQGRPKNVNRVFLRVYKSSGVWAGPDANNLREYKQRRAEPYGSPPNLIEAEEIEIPVAPSWSSNGQILVRQSDPLPLTVVSMTLDVAVGG
jgi:hypothetical protein